MRIYASGIFDLFHRGHVEYFKKIKELYPNCTLVVGLAGDKDAASYKRRPVFKEEDRYEILKSIKYIDEVIFPVPIINTEKFLKKHNIDLVIHTFSDTVDANKQDVNYEVPKKLGIFKEIPYYQGISTTEIIKKIKKDY